MLINPIITEVNSSDKRKICNFTLNHAHLGNLDVKTYQADKYSNMLYIDILNKDKFVIGREVLGLEDKKGEIFGFDISVERKFRKNSLGELLRLVSIIEMLENDKNEIEIASKPNAIYFHSKYKFEPCIKSFFNRDSALVSCIKNECKDMAQEQEEATKLLQEIKNNKEVEKGRDYCKIVSTFIKNYINKVLTLPKEKLAFYPFDYGFNMKLTKENVIKNMDFFNNLFKKHGINYKI